ncbi:hypothetical protein ACTG9Q_03620 [Actinokineospora sp. 24-640]
MSTRDGPPVMPTADEAGGDRVDPPLIIHVAYWLWLVAGAVGLAGAVALMLNQGAVAANWARSSGVELIEARDIVKGYTVWLSVGSVVFLLFYLLLAHQARNGVRKARTLLLVTGVIGALFQYGFGRITIFGLLSTLLTLAAIALLVFPAARRFYDAHGR